MEIPGKEWTIREWRTAKRGEIVRHDSGVLGRVVDVRGIIGKKTLCVVDEKDSEIYTEEPAELFWVESQEVSREFHIRRFRAKRLGENQICSVEGAPHLPVMIEKLEWLTLYQKMRFWLRDMSSPEKDLIKTENERLLVPFDIGLPTEIGPYLDNTDSGLSWKIVFETSGGWGSHGSPLKFSTEEIAKKFANSLAERAIIRRVASVISGTWKPDFSNGEKKYIVMIRNGRCYVKETIDMCGSPAYFQTPMHAAFAIEVLGEDRWIRAYDYENDTVMIDR
jgi:hypothetical protein